MNSNELRKHYQAITLGLRGEEYRKTMEQIIAELGEENVRNSGVYVDTEEITISDKPFIDFDVVKGSDGLWRYGYRYMGKTSGGGSPATIFCYGYKTREEALKAAAEYMLERREDIPDSVRKRLEDLINLPAEQLGLWAKDGS